jgi:prophage tail gpP-like protein
LLTRTGVRRVVGAAIERGVGGNVVSAGFVRSMEERYSTYIFKSQVACTDDVNGGAASPRSTVTDAGVDRYRPLVVERDTQGRSSSGGQFTSEKVTHDLMEAAEWERNTRAGKAIQLTYEIKNPTEPSRSWEEAPGSGLLWEPNTIVVVRDPRYSLDGEFLIVEVRFSLDNGGTRTTMRLTAPEAYQPKKPPTKKKKKGTSW